MFWLKKMISLTSYKFLRISTYRLDILLTFRYTHSFEKGKNMLRPELWGKKTNGHG